MKSTLLATVTCLGAIGLGAIGLATVVFAEPIQGGATDLLLPEEKITAPFEYNTDELDQLSTRINHSITVDNENTVPINWPSQDSNSSDAVVIINSDGSVAGGGEVEPR